MTGQTSPQVLVVDAATGAHVGSLTDSVLETMGGASGTPVLGAAHDLLTVGNRVISFDLQGRTTAWRVRQLHRTARRR